MLKWYIINDEGGSNIERDMGQRDTFVKKSVLRVRDVFEDSTYFYTTRTMCLSKIFNCVLIFFVVVCTSTSNRTLQTSTGTRRRHSIILNTESTQYSILLYRTITVLSTESLIASTQVRTPPDKCTNFTLPGRTCDAYKRSYSL